MRRVLVTLRIIIPVALVVGVLWGSYLARDQIKEGFSPPYASVKDLLINIAASIIQLIVAAWLIDYFAKSADRRLVRIASERVQHSYNSYLFPLLRDIRDFLALREEWRQAESRTTAEDSGETTYNAHLEKRSESLIESMKINLDRSQYFVQSSFRLISILSPSEVVAISRISDEIEQFRYSEHLVLDSTSLIRAQIVGSQLYQKLYPQVLAFAASIASPLLEFERRYILGTDSSEHYQSTESGLKRLSDRPFSRVRKPGQAHDPYQTGIVIESSIAESFLNEMTAWKTITGSDLLVAHGFSKDDVKGTQHHRRDQQNRFALWFRLCKRLRFRN